MPADRLAFVLYCERYWHVHRPHEVQVVAGIAPGVRVRELIAQIGCNLEIVGVAQQGVDREVERVDLYGDPVQRGEDVLADEGPALAERLDRALGEDGVSAARAGPCWRS